MQELSNNSHHKIAFNYDEDTMSLVEEQSKLLPHWKYFSPTTLIPLLGMHP
jgi:hypothetical protein